MSYENPPKCPKSPSDVTPEWLKMVMKTAQKTDIDVIHLTPIADNAGFLSATFRAQVKTNDEKMLNLFIKTGAEMGQDEQLDTFVKNTSIDMLEVKAYKEDLVQLINFELEHLGTSKIAGFIPKIYACDFDEDNNERGLYLIMEDLTNDYVQVDKSIGTSFEGMKVIIESIARFHAVSYCYGEKKGIVFRGKEQKHPMIGFIALKDRIDKVDGFFPMVKEDLYNNEVGQNLLPYFDRLSNRWQSAMTKGFEETNDCQFLSHGDLWVNNVMVRKDDAACKIFDWQFLCPSKGPYFDFVRAVAYGTKPDNATAWWNDLVNAYMDEMESTCMSLKVKSPFNRQEFERNLLAEGFFPNFCMTFLDYELNCRQCKMLDQFMWVTSMAVKHSPDRF